MARKNKLGTPFANVGLTQAEEKKLKAYLKKEDLSFKKLQRQLVRDFINTLK